MWTGALAPRRGQFAANPDSEPAYTIPGLAPAGQQPQDTVKVWQQQAREAQALSQQVAQVNQSDPYISPADGRWKKQMADPFTGEINESDVLDSGTGTTDRGTGNIYVQTSQGPQVIAVDPQQKRLAQIVDQKAQAQALGSPIDANIDAARSALAATQRQLQAFQGLPDRMAAQIGKYTQASLDPGNTAAAAQLQQAQSVFNDWKQQNPAYTALTARRDALANQIQSQTAAKGRNDLQVAQLLTTPQYAQWNGNTPPSPNAIGQDASAPAGSAPASDVSIHDLDGRAGVIAAQNGIPPALGYASALAEAKQQGARSLDGAPLDAAIQGIQPAVQSQLLTMTPPQLRQAFQSGVITRQQAQTALTAQRVAQNQPASTTGDTGQDTDPTAQSDPVAQSVSDLTAKAADLRNKIQSAFDTGGADGVRDLATYRAALADTESQLHAATQTLLSRVPADIQQRIARAVAPAIDWDDAAQQNAQDPMAHFATENLGSALRDQDMPPYQQSGIRQLASANGVNPDLADHIAHQALGANAVRDLYVTVLRGGAIDPQRAQTLQDMGFLQQSDPNDPTSPLHLTEDAQRLLPPGVQSFVQVRPDVARYTPSPDPAHGSALYQNAIAGMQHFADTAEKTLPAQPSEPDADATSQAVPSAAQEDTPSVGVAPQQTTGTVQDAPPGRGPAKEEVAQPNHSTTNASNALDGALGAIPGLDELPDNSTGGIAQVGSATVQDAQKIPTDESHGLDDESLLKSNSSDAANAQGPLSEFDANEGREQSEDEKNALNKMRSIEAHIRLNAEAYADKAAALQKAGNSMDAKKAQDSARAEKQRADGLNASILQIDALIRSSPNVDSDPSALRIIDQAFHSWMNDELQASYRKEGDGGARRGGPYGNSDKCNIALFDWLTGSKVVDKKSLTREDNGHAMNAEAYNDKKTQIPGLSSGEPQTWPHTDKNGMQVKQSQWSGEEPKAGDIVTYGDTIHDAHATISLGGGWHIGASETPGPDGSGQKPGININTDEFDHGDPGWFEDRMVRRSQ